MSRAGSEANAEAINAVRTMWTRYHPPGDARPAWRCLVSFMSLLVACGWMASAPTPAPEPAPLAPVAPPTVHERVIVSEAYRIDKKYMSMTGPYGFNDVVLLDADKPELLWIVGYTTTVVAAEDESELSQEWMCHANLDFDTSVYFEHFPTAPSLSGRVFTLSQGQQDIQFPGGFGVPVTSDLPISLATQVLNLNQPDIDATVKHQVTIRYVRDSELQAPLVPMFQSAVEGFKALGDARYYGVEHETHADADMLGPGCSVGQAAIAGDVDEDHLGQAFTAHWKVEPGREVNVTNVTRFLNLPYDTTAHYIAVHLHPFAHSLTLRDLTTGENVYEAFTRQAEGRVGLDHIDHYEGADGIPLYKDHEYELVSVYENTTDDVVDSMAVMYLYLRDKRFDKPDLDRPKFVASAEEPESASM
ncbi:MAG: hypothetical protein ACI8PZ_002402 [Myxococcota bacterium]|jgi:hypothetical protein